MNGNSRKAGDDSNTGKGTGMREMEGRGAALGLTREEKQQAVFDKYSDMIRAKGLRWYFSAGTKWDKRKINRFLKFFCIPMKLEDTVAFLDTTLFKSAREGLLFVKDGIVVKETLNRLYYLKYSKIQQAELVEQYNDAGYLTESQIIIHFKDGTRRNVFDYYIRKHYFVDYINEVVSLLAGYEPKPAE